MNTSLTQAVLHWHEKLESKGSEYKASQLVLFERIIGICQDYDPFPYRHISQHRIQESHQQTGSLRKGFIEFTRKTNSYVSQGINLEKPFPVWSP